MTEDLILGCFLKLYSLAYLVKGGYAIVTFNIKHASKVLYRRDLQDNNPVVSSSRGVLRRSIATLSF